MQSIDVSGTRKKIGDVALEWMKHGANVALFIGLIASVAFLVGRLERVTRLEHDFAAFKGEMEARLSRGGQVLAEHDRMIKAHENYFIGTVDPKITELEAKPAARVPVIPAYLRNRDEEFGRLIRDLQKLTSDLRTENADQMRRIRELEHKQ